MNNKNFKINNTKYYIIKPISVSINKQMIEGIKSIDKNAILIKDISKANICILQKGWTHSKKAIEEKEYAIKKNIPCKEGYLYTDYYKVHIY